VIRIKGVLHDVPLCNTKTFDKPIGGVGQTVRVFAMQMGRQVFQSSVEDGVGVLFGEKRD
jgi:hypothetical protein